MYMKIEFKILKKIVNNAVRNFEELEVNSEMIKSELGLPVELSLY